MSYNCDEEVFGQPNFYSCMDAYAQMPPGKYARSYGDRGNRQPYDFPLPLRYASGKWQLVEDSESMAQTDDVPGDGTCIIEVFPIVEGFSDLMKPLDLKMAVQKLIQDCVAGDNPKGGIAERMGQADRLSVFVARIEPNSVRCFYAAGSPPVTALCPFGLNRMPVSDENQIFGQRGTPNIDVALPVRYADSLSECAIDVVIDGPPARANWYDIWGSAVMVVAMCARFGMSGSASTSDGGTILAVRVTNDAPATLSGAAA
ncbi:hypothetical protein IMSHALPRED_009842 [Imshaugia aleurites]|uniref:Uncharacterized protein n=1 Tax=Imshaugia aleurites TaxID=172621 RepID=A0A8H3IZB9_9LECA|nr:hypothetical protein IMSHALPRED_009842 [Imshaugia aleurites]